MSAALDALLVADELRRAGGDAYRGHLRGALRRRGHLGTGRTFERRLERALHDLHRTGRITLSVESDGDGLVALTERNRV